MIGFDVLISDLLDRVVEEKVAERLREREEA